ncbi:MAG: hypothetical protein V2A78_04400 [bacterium]
MKKVFPMFFVLLLVAIFVVSCATPPATNQPPVGTQVSPGASPGASPAKIAKEKTLKGIKGMLVFEAPVPAGKLEFAKADPKTQKEIKFFSYKGLILGFEVPGMSSGSNLLVGEDGSFELLDINVSAALPAQIKKYDKIVITMPKFKEVVLMNVPSDPMKPSDIGKIVLKHANAK